MRKGMMVLMTIAILMTGTKNLYAYQYMFNNNTYYPIRLTAEVYTGEDKTCHIDPNGSCSFSTDLLLKSWKAEASLDDRWKQILHLKCDFLPGNHSFSIQVDETMDPGGSFIRNWYSTNQ